ncbi:MAG: hypothetical protein ACRCTQ_05590 [Brevinemataceae bacterium]
MRYLSIYGAGGFRTFSGMISGKLAYTPEKIPKIDQEILAERDFVQRLHMLIDPYTGNHYKLNNILPIIPSDIGTVHEITPKFSVWHPKIHLADLGEHLIAATLAEFLPEKMQNTLNFVADYYDSGLSFANAFALEKKEIFFPLSLKDSIILPPTDQNTILTAVDQEEKIWINSRKMFMKNVSVRFDGVNFIRILGHMATIIQALYETERKRIRFFNDLVSLALPADDIEFILAGYYLAQSPLPIKHIYTISSDHRMIHHFLEKGTFQLTTSKPRAAFMISLYRMLFEASRGSVDKVTRWKNELKTQGSFRVDAKTFDSLTKTLKPIFSKKTLLDSVQESFTSHTDIAAAKITLSAYAASLTSQEQILAFERQNPLLEKTNQPFSITKELPSVQE